MKLHLTGNRALITVGACGLGRHGLASVCVAGNQRVTLPIKNPRAA